MNATVSEDIKQIVEAMKVSTALDSVKAYLTAENKKVVGIPFFIDGHPMEINLRLMEKGKDNVLKFQRYPLIALRLDTNEGVDDGRVIRYNLNIAILSYTDKGYTTEQRREKVFKPVLYPLYEEFLKQLRKSYLFMWPSGRFPKHQKIDRYYYGSIAGDGTGTDKNVFSDPLDAIEILNLEISKLKTCIGNSAMSSRLFDKTFDKTFN